MVPSGMPARSLNSSTESPRRLCSFLSLSPIVIAILQTYVVHLEGKKETDFRSRDLRDYLRELIFRQLPVENEGDVTRLPWWAAQMRKWTMSLTSFLDMPEVAAK